MLLHMKACVRVHIKAESALSLIYATSMQLSIKPPRQETTMNNSWRAGVWTLQHKPHSGQPPSPMGGFGQLTEATNTVTWTCKVKPVTSANWYQNLTKQTCA